eukprot:CAMPEP_0181533078 /NCGR_PEP_ID=MMETSP1110-20121109/72962_1 /TAXON_ID=174948 /ORGANISM="Symbiodinium sp., Strain CCMP421" /LENGTH=92 /DNA_ID=CAMNT_0023664231 /DNA_START=82 /DNA_END=357 /DNA_ORIENTATION=+
MTPVAAAAPAEAAHAATSRPGAAWLWPCSAATRQRSEAVLAHPAALRDTPRVQGLADLGILRQDPLGCDWRLRAELLDVPQDVEELAHVHIR